MNVNLSRRRLQLIEQGLNCLIQRYENALALNPKNAELLAARDEVLEFLSLVTYRQRALPLLEDV
jgi:hypothetical protein